MREIKESDWKILRELYSVSLERFCRQILLEVKQIDADGAKSFHQKYLDIFRLVQRRDREIARVFNNPRRSTALIQLAEMESRSLLSAGEYLRFSEGTRNIIAHLLRSDRAGEK
jgi:inhibitor of KinA sporulation pathway (predicted exonuclease)